MNEPTPERKRLTIRHAEYALHKIGFSKRESARLVYGGYKYAFALTVVSGAPRRWWQFFIRTEQKK
jgi:hypothetical protein